MAESTWANISSLVKPWRSMLLLRQKATHVPQPWQSPGLMCATVLITLPSRAVMGSISMAWYGHMGTHNPQPTQVEKTGGAQRLTTATTGSRTRQSWEKSAATLAAAPDAAATVSGMSLGLWHAPASSTPAVLVSTGRSLGCASAKKLYWS